MENINTQNRPIQDQSKLIQLEKGKLPPQAVDLEEVVLGAMLIDKKGIDEVIDLLKPDTFYDKKHQAIFEAIQILFEKGDNIDLLTVSEQLRRMKKFSQVGEELLSHTAYIKGELRSSHRNLCAYYHADVYQAHVDSDVQ